MLRAYKLPNLPKQQQFLLTLFYGMMGGVSFPLKQQKLPSQQQINTKPYMFVFRTIVYFSIYYNIALYSEINDTSC